MNTSTGFIVAIDGPDGSGKTTQIQLLKESLEKQGYMVHLTRSSGGTPIGEELRKASLSDAQRSAEVDLYISLAMGVALGDDLKERRDSGEIILIDRSPLAIIAYQNFGSQLKDQQLGYDACEKLLRLWNIDLLLVFDISEQELKKRDDLRKLTHPDETTNYFEKRDVNYKHRVHNGYYAGLKHIQDLADIPTTINLIDANHDQQSIEKTIRKVIDSYI